MWIDWAEWHEETLVIRLHAVVAVLGVVTGSIVFGFTLAPGRMPAEIFLEQPARVLTGSDRILWVFPLSMALLGLWLLRPDVADLLRRRRIKAAPDKA